MFIYKNFKIKKSLTFQKNVKVNYEKFLMTEHSVLKTRIKAIYIVK